MADPTPFTTDVLLEHQDFLRALARSLLADEHAADDVLQETYVAALTRPPDAVDSGRAWLARIAHNLALNRLRGDRRRTRRESSVARPEAVPHGAEAAERLAEQRHVVDAVLALREPYRTAIYLRFCEGLPPRAIARRLGLPIETVRSRQKRGLAELRRTLEREFGDRRASLLVLARLAAPGGALAAKTSFFVALAAFASLFALFAVATWHATDRWQASVVPDAARPASPDQEGAPLGSVAIPRSRTDLAVRGIEGTSRSHAIEALDARTSSSDPVAAASGEGVAYRLDLSSPIAFEPNALVARLAHVGDLSIDASDFCSAVEAGDPPWVRFASRPPISLIGTAERSAYELSIESRDGLLAGSALVHAVDADDSVVVVPMTLRGVLAGRVTESDGLPLAGARVELAARGVLVHSVLADANGSYRFGAVEHGTVRVLVRSARHVPFERELAVVAGETSTANLGLERVPLAALSGTLASKARASLPRGVLRLRSVENAATVATTVARPATAGERLVFRFDDVPVGAYELLPPLEDGFAWDPSSLRVVVPGPEVHLTRLDGAPARSIVFRAFDGETGERIESFQAALLLDRYALGKRRALAIEPPLESRATRFDAVFLETLPRDARAYWVVEHDGHRSAYGDLGEARNEHGRLVVEVRLEKSFKVELRIQALGEDGQIVALEGAEVRTSGGKRLGRSLADGRVQLELAYDPGRIEVVLEGWSVERWEGFWRGKRRSELGVHRVWMERE